MQFNLISLLYFIIVSPVVAFVLIFLKRVAKHEKSGAIIVVLSALLFFVRLMLVFFQEWIGIMPYVKDDVLFYGFLTVFGVVFSIYYVMNVEEIGFRDIGFDVQKHKYNLIFSALGFVPLILLLPLVSILGEIPLSLDITVDKLILGMLFGWILGGFYEEVMFRGVIQNHFAEIWGEKKAIVPTAVVFTATHIFYLPFDGFFIYYIFLFVMALILSLFRYLFNQLACFMVHGGIVFILILFV